MWDLSSAWFDVAVVMTVFAVGNVLFGHFEEHRPAWRRVLKVVLVTALVAVLTSLGLRWAGYAVIGALAAAALYVHGWWLPRHGVNGWTGEPRERYYELIGVRPPDRDDGRARGASTER